MNYGDDYHGWLLYVVGGILIGVLLSIIGMVAMSLPDSTGAANCPLDAIRYQAPPWAHGSVFKVVDRTDGAAWWVVKVNGETVSLPISVRDVDIRQIGG